MLKLMYITNQPQIAKIAYEAGVDRIFVDIETIGKTERQGGMDTVQSHHTLDDVKKIRNAFNGELLVRSNHIFEGSKEEIDRIIENGADVVMLPYFKSVNDAAKFIDIVDGRAKVNLLVETAEAVNKLDGILELDGVDEIHVGLNDLHLAYGMKFMFELVADGTVDRLARQVLASGKKFGFGGIAGVGKGMIPAEMVIREHYRIGSTCAILSRAFCNTEVISDISQIKDTFIKGVKAIRDVEVECQKHLDYFKNNQDSFVKNVNTIIEKH